MSSSNPCAVYNFYNCCGHGNGSGSAGSAPFIWQTGTLEPLTPVVTLGNNPNAALKAYLGLMPLHKKAQLQDIMLLRFAEMNTGTLYTGAINFDLVVMDFAGVVKRQISTVTLNYRNIPLSTWTPITLSAVAGDLDVAPGELIAGQLTFGTALPSGTSIFSAIYQLSGTGMLL